MGADLGAEGLPPVTGNAGITLALAAMDDNARFTDLQVLTNSGASPFRAPPLEYGIRVTGNAFSDADQRVYGAWYGDAHDEAAGTARRDAWRVRIRTAPASRSTSMARSARTSLTGPPVWAIVRTNV